MQCVNQQGERKLTYIKAKNASLRAEKQTLLKALEISRESSSHFTNIASYWNWNIIPYCAEDDCCKDCDTSSSSHNALTLTAASSTNTSLGTKSP